MPATDDVLANAWSNYLGSVDNQSPIADPFAQEPGPSVDDQIANELANSPTTNPQVNDPKQWDPYIDGSIVNGGEIEMPAESARPPLSTSTSTSNTVRGSHTQSTASGHTGYAGGASQVDRDFADARQRATDRAAALDPQYERETAAADQYYDATRAATANIGSLKQQQFDTEAGTLEKLDKLNTEHLAALKQLQDEGKVARERIIGEARQQMAAVRQLVQTDPNPLHSLGLAQKIGLGTAAFAQGFLATRGYKIDVTGQIDNWVAEAVKEHQQKVQNMQGDVNNTLHLYDIARQSSNDDYEAMMRYRAMFIEGTKVQLQASAARFNSQIAVQQAAEGEAQLNMMQEQTISHIADRKVKNASDIMKQELDGAKEAGKLKIESDHNKQMEGIGWMDANTKRMEANIKQKAADKEAMAGSMKIQDPSQVQKDAKGNVVSGGKFIAAIDPNLPKPLYEQVYKRVTDAQQLYGELHSNLAHMKALKAKLDLSGPDWWKRTDSEDYREYDTARNLTVASVRKFMSGTASSDKEGEMFAKTLEGDQWLQKGNNDKLIPTVDGWGRRHFNTAINIPGVIANDKADEYAPKIEVDPSGVATESINELDAKKAPPAKTALSRDYNTAADVTGGIEGADRDPDHPFEMAPKVAGSASWKKLMGSSEWPTNAEAVDHIVAAVIKPAEYREHVTPDIRNPNDTRHGVSIPDDDKVLAQQGEEALVRLAQDKKIGDVGPYATKWLDLIKKDPQAAEELYRSNRGTW